jgi:hypothetical protein
MMGVIYGVKIKTAAENCSASVYNKNIVKIESARADDESKGRHERPLAAAIFPCLRFIPFYVFLIYRDRACLRAGYDVDKETPTAFASKIVS